MGKEVIDITPKWLGMPMYPAGIPVKSWQINFEGETLQQMIDKFWDGKLEDEKHIYLKQYIKYYVSAPLFKSEFTDELRKTLNTKLLSIHEMVDECMEYGLDPI